MYRFGAFRSHLKNLIQGYVEEESVIIGQDSVVY
jgi:hypothetical protein